MVRTLIWGAIGHRRPVRDRQSSRIGFYVSASRAWNSTYGASASIVIVPDSGSNYSAQILLFGAEFTHVWAAAAKAGKENSDERNEPN